MAEMVVWRLLGIVPKSRMQALVSESVGAKATLGNNCKDLDLELTCPLVMGPSLRRAVCGN